MSPLPEDGPMEDIEAFFAERGFDLVVHEERRPEPSSDDWRRMSSVEREARRKVKWSHWADLQGVDSSVVVQRWYGDGMSAEEAVRSARSRYRVEQGDDF